MKLKQYIQIRNPLYTIFSYIGTFKSGLLLLIFQMFSSKDLRFDIFRNDESERRKVMIEGRMMVMKGDLVDGGHRRLWWE